MDQIIENLYVGSSSCATQEPLDGIDEVVTMCKADNHATTAHFPIRDEEGHDYAKFKQAVEYVVSCLEKDATVLVHCAAGISRGPTVVVTALALYTNCMLEEAYDKVNASHPQTRPEPSLRDSAMKCCKDIRGSDERF